SSPPRTGRRPRALRIPAAYGPVEARGLASECQAGLPDLPRGGADGSDTEAEEGGAGSGAAGGGDAAQSALVDGFRERSPGGSALVSGSDGSGPVHGECILLLADRSLTAAKVAAALDRAVAE